ncbi:uncharacterized protein LOC133286244 [Gastrolobium bilobum]|uniref:uncharacterized protein LOC133286244 n=1 Tax=Gastrolobium bilobum TaxID=150636 RepID=UPI002AB06A5D|nr:uncharacterized protein LOC133286244 [Gastrolobium bilobum]XP_061339619.1 uncharacterized protein LOC133286244 [Gastrolobium bilobum]
MIDTYSLKNNKNREEGMQLLQEDPPLSLSGAYVRSLVKQLTTSKPKDTMNTNTKDPGCVVDVKVPVPPNQNLRKHGKVLGGRQAQLPIQQQQQQQYKKQVRRRLHSGRPYQERLLNMAEARKEIVTALKFHRASMKQASEQHQQPSLSLQPSHLSSFEQDERFNSRRNPRIYPSCTTKFSNYMDDFSYSSISHPSPPSVPISYTLPVASQLAPPPPPMAENPNFTLPNQSLGLNLNLHDFNNLGATLFLNNNNNDGNNSSSYSCSSLTSSSPPPLSVVTVKDVPSNGTSQGEGVSSLVDTIESSATTQVTEGLHTAMDDEGMAEIRSLGEQYQMEWNDTMNLVTSAWWFNFLKNMEHDAPQVKTEDDAYHHIFDELREFPA